ncbi:putative RND superfamily exporter [Frankia torreyi]|uniref:Putative RND superfamily exporter n=2 Tax=Frankia TaxID=1854 RepID=A0A0D8BDN5_9ACTN|nr:MULTISPECIES: MMPL family transporter [Frankia]KJE22180.1 putative RND superfamily exporter [Frankia torreyi]
MPPSTMPADDPTSPPDPTDRTSSSDADPGAPSSRRPTGPRARGPADPPDGPGGRWRALVARNGRRSGVVAVVTLLVTLVLGYGLNRLEFTTGQDNYLNSDSQVARDNVDYQSLFGGQAMLTLFTIERGADADDLFTPHNIKQFRDLQAELDADPRVQSTITPLTALEFTDNLVRSKNGNVLDSPAAKILLGAQSRDPDPGSAQRRLADSLATLKRMQAIPEAQRTVDNPAWVDFLLHDNTGAIRKSLRPFFPTPSTAQMVTRLEGNASLDAEGEGARIVERATSGLRFDHATAMTTGAAVLLRDINNYLRGGFLTLGAISLALMAGLLVVAFAVRWRLLPLGVVGVGLIWAFGLAGYIGVPLSVVTIAGLPVLLGVGIDFAVQFHSRVEEEAQLDRAGNPVMAALAGLLPALALATVAAVLAFLALEFSQVPMIRDFGTLLALGLPVIVVATVLLLTASLTMRERRRPTPPKDYTHGPLGRTVIRLGALPRITAIPLVVAAVAIFIGGIFADGRLTIQTDPEKWVDQQSQVIKNINTLRASTGSASELGIFVQSGDVFDDATAGFVGRFANAQLAAHPDDLLDASSLVTTISFMMEVPNTTVVMPTGADIRLAYQVAPPDVQRAMVNREHHALNLVFRTGSGSLERQAGVVDDIRDHVRPAAGISATPSGLAVVGTGLLDNFARNRVELTYYALAAVFVLLVLYNRSLVRAVLSVVPVLIAVGLSSIIAMLIGVDLSPLTAVSGPLIIALCTEFTTLLVLRHLEERRRGLGPLEAVEAAAARTGRAFLVSALAAVIGVAVLAFSSLPLLRDFGLLVALNVAVALLSALVVLPPLLVWADERGWVHRRGGGGAVAVAVLEPGLSDKRLISGQAATGQTREARSSGTPRGGGDAAGAGGSGPGAPRAAPAPGVRPAQRASRRG